MTRPVTVHQLSCFGEDGPGGVERACPECGTPMGVLAGAPYGEFVDALAAGLSQNGSLIVSDYSKAVWEKLRLEGATFRPVGDGWGLDKWLAKRWQLVPSTVVGELPDAREVPCSSCHTRYAADIKDFSTWKPDAEMAGDVALGIGAHWGQIACSAPLQDALERLGWIRFPEELGELSPILSPGPVTPENWNVLIELVQHLGTLSELHPGPSPDVAVIPVPDDVLYSSVCTTGDLDRLLETMRQTCFPAGWIWFPQWNQELRVADDMIARPGRGGFLEWSPKWRVSYEKQSITSHLECPGCGLRDQIRDVLAQDLRCGRCGYAWQVTDLRSYETIHYNFGASTIHPRWGSMKAPVVYRLRIGVLNREGFFPRGEADTPSLLSFLFRMSRSEVSLLGATPMWVS